MKLIQTFVFFFLSLVCFSQTGEIDGKIISTDLKYLETLNILLVKNDSIIQSKQADREGNFSFKNLSKRSYTIKVQELGYRDYVIDNVEVGANLKIQHPFPCNYNLMAKPKCTKGHTNHIVNIAYGLPGRKLMKKAEKGKVRLGGCIVTNCDPHYYCTIHKIEF